MNATNILIALLALFILYSMIKIWKIFSENKILRQKLFDLNGLCSRYEKSVMIREGKFPPKSNLKCGDKFIESEWWIEGDKPDETFTVIKAGRTKVILVCDKFTSGNIAHYGIFSSLSNHMRVSKDDLFSRDKWLPVSFVEQINQGDSEERSPEPEINKPTP